MQEKWKPEEVHHFEAAIARIVRDKTRDKSEAWKAMLSAWREHFEGGPYEKQAERLLGPILENYAHISVQRYLDTKKNSELDRAIMLQQELVRRFPMGMRFLVNLGKIYRYHHEMTQLATDRDKAIEIFQQVLRIDPDQEDSNKCLQELLTERYQTQNNREDLSELVQLIEYTLFSQHTTEPEPLARIHARLGQVYKELYRLQSRVEDLNQAIKHLEQATKSQDTGIQTTALSLLGFLLRDRGDFRQDLEDWRSAVAVWQEAIQNMPIHASETDEIVIGTSVILKDIFEMTQDPIDLSVSIQHLETCLARGSQEAPLLPFLAYNFVMQFEFYGDLSYLDQAITYLEQALMQPEDLQSHADNLENLSNVLRRRAEVSGNKKDLERAEGYAKDALKTLHKGE